MKTFRKLLGVVAVVLAGQAGRATAQTFTLLHSFNNADGLYVESGLAEGTDHNLYGTTLLGGALNNGVVYRLSPTGSGFTNLYTFRGFSSGGNGQNIKAGLTVGTDSNFYGVASVGGTTAAGMVFRMTADGSLTNIHSFVSASDGSSPQATMLLGRDGNFYGTTTGGGPGKSGTVYRVSASGVFTTLHAFTNSSTEGGIAFAGLTEGTNGVFYGCSYQGGAYGMGTVFRVTSVGDFATLHSFNGTNGFHPYSRPLLASDGNFYGTTVNGGASTNCPTGCGTIYRLSASGSLTTLYSFTGPDGTSPFGGLIEGRDGNLYGLTDGGGTNACGCGTIYRFTFGGVLTTLHSFGGADGRNPIAELIQASDGAFYGTTESGGASEAGTVFKFAVPAPPLAPTKLRALAQPNTSVYLAWKDNSDNETKFRLQRALASAGPWATIANVGANVVNYFDTNTTAGTTYFYRVRAINPVGKSPQSNVASATPLATSSAPSSASDLVATAISSTQIDLSWVDNADNESGFKITRALSPTNTFAIIATTGADITTYSDKTATPATTWYYKVRAYNPSGSAPPPPVANATTPP